MTLIFRRPVLGLAALLAVTAGALVASGAATRAAVESPLVVVAAKGDRLADPGERDRLDAAFSDATAAQRAAFAIVTADPQADACLPACSSIVYKSSRPGEPSRIVSGAPNS